MDFPYQEVSRVGLAGSVPSPGSSFDMRAHLQPRRLTMLMWDQAFLLRHAPDESFADWDRVLDEAAERGYNTLRLDPLPEAIDLERPDQMLSWGEYPWPYLPWNWQRAITCPAGRWLIDFMQRAAERGFWFTLSAWWSCDDKAPPSAVRPRDTMQGAELWARMLRGLKREVGLERILYVDYANEMPYFFPDFMGHLCALADPTAVEGNGYNERQRLWLRKQLEKPLLALQAEFPEMRFTHSIHGDPRWFSVGLTALDCLDVHFYADADPRWASRTQFRKLTENGRMFREDTGFADFSARCATTQRAMRPMLRARQRQLMRQFSAWAGAGGMPLTCSEGWASWFYLDYPGVDWGWLLEWSEEAVDDAIEFGFWGVTPNNYCQPQFALWADCRFHQRINQRFLSS
jgi:hypothetical protein